MRLTYIIRLFNILRNIFDNPINVPGLGELQINFRQREDSYKKGYKGGQPDILILNYHKKYRGLAIELKTPTNKGILSEKKTHYLEVLKNNGYYTIVSNDYDYLIHELENYFHSVRKKE